MKISCLEEALKIVSGFKEIEDEHGNIYIVYENSMLKNVVAIQDKTAFEAIENHVHVFDRVNRRNMKELQRLAPRLCLSLLSNLKYNYPHKCFVVYATMSLHDSMIIRFHQQWPGENAYYDEFNSDNEYIWMYHG